jgi:hypothetical protein
LYNCAIWYFKATGLLDDSCIVPHRGAGRKKSYSEETERRIQELYSLGSSMDDLAIKFSLSKGTVFKIIHAD